MDKMVGNKAVNKEANRVYNQEDSSKVRREVSRDHQDRSKGSRVAKVRKELKALRAASSQEGPEYRLGDDRY